MIVCAMQFRLIALLDVQDKLIESVVKRLMSDAPWQCYCLEV